MQSKLKSRGRSGKGGFIEKLYTFPDDRTRTTDREFQQKNAFLQSIVDDGGLDGRCCENQHLYHNQRFTVLYSLNKRKRWMLPELFEAAEDRLGDAQFPVSCLVRTATPALGPTDSYQDYHTARTAKPMVISLSMYPTTVVEAAEAGCEDLEKRKTRKGSKKNRLAHFSDCAIQVKNLTASQKGKSKISARKIDFGILYNVGVPIPSYHTSRLIRKQSLAHRRNESRRTKRAATPNIPLDLINDDCIEEDDALMTDSSNSNPLRDHESQKAFRQTFDLLELLERPYQPVRARSRPSSSVKTDSSDRFDFNPDIQTTLPAVETATVETTDNQSSSVRIRANEESQRTFHLSGSSESLSGSSDSLSVSSDNLSGSSDNLSSALRQSGLELTCLSAGQCEEGVAFLDVGLAVHVVLLVRRSLFGLLVCLKGPSAWLESLQELRTVSDIALLSFQARPSTGSDIPSSLEKCLTFHTVRSNSAAVLRPVLTNDETETSTTDLAAYSDCCPICCEGSEAIVRNVCGHGMCASCWKLHLVAKVSEGTANVKCPMPDCGHPVDPALVGLTVPWHTVEAWQNRHLDTTVATLQGKYCPTTSCLGIFLPETARSRGRHHIEKTLVHCQGCSKRFCWTCEEEWHWPSSCAAADAYRLLIAKQDDDPWLRYSQRARQVTTQTKSCPNCRQKMEKGEGCNHMTCFCGTEFCWLCLKRTDDEDYYSDHDCGKEKPFDSTKLKDVLVVVGREDSYRAAVELRSRRHDLWRAKQFDTSTKETLFYLYHVMEYVFAYESQLPISRRNTFSQGRPMLDLIFISDLIVTRYRDQRIRKTLAERARCAVLRLQDAFVSR
ncbi:putative E3 ubiquitin-protein ligase ARI9 [Hypsibius exemplaris]|uniref:RBR-type E3 ubiquitin transferase n=1 Tax=Hypsibius exemplaris TaxID=2072580 RepID=A0A1W0WTP6_HYPEX|nr:putative E3 ubiquitin-protein ligase ARI9 [Hypsibius exemplaris]